MNVDLSFRILQQPTRIGSDRVTGDILTGRICDSWLGLEGSYLIIELY